MLPAAAQQSDRGTIPTVQNPTERAKKPATNPGSVKRANPLPATAASERGTAPDDGRGWTLDDALMTRRSPASVSANSPPPLQERAPLGRLQVNQGTFGIETESKFKEGEFSDGRRVPGLETTKREQPSFFGLSLSVPTIDKSLMPSLPRPD